MKEATWNLERVNKNAIRKSIIIESLIKLNADILILTETNECINLGEDYYIIHSSKLTESIYEEEERRVSIFSKYRILEKIETHNNETSLCVVIGTPFGKLAIYGTIIGIYGNRHQTFNTDLEKILQDIQEISISKNICIGGDFNISFLDNYYFTEMGRQKLNNCFEKLQLSNLTKKIAENIDHIVIAENYVGICDVDIKTWNLDKKLSDHIGVMAIINKK